MKRIFVVVLALSLAFQQFAQAGWRGQDKSMTAGDFFCGLVGGLATGALAHNAIGKDPVTLIVGFIGAAVGVDYCQYLRDEEQQALKLLVEEGLNADLGQTVRVKTADYDAFITTKKEGYKTGFFGGDAHDNICRYFEFSIYRQSGEYLGRSRGWACKESDSRWVITDSRWIKEERRVATRRTYDGSSNGGQVGGAIGIGQGHETIGVGGSGAGAVPAPSQGGIILNWDIRQAPRTVKDGYIERPLQLLNRRAEIGFFKSASADGTGVRLYVNGDDLKTPVVGDGYNPFESVNNFGIECGVTPFCSIRAVRTTDGVEGVMKFLFRNGDIGIESSYHGLVIRPFSSVLQ